MIVQKTFYKILLDFNVNPFRAKQCLNDKRLTLVEKKIIESYLHIRNNQNQLAIDHISSVASSEAPLVEGQRHLVLGLALNNISHFEEAEKRVKEAIRHLNQIKAPYFQFIAHLYLFTVYSNMNRLDLMKQTLDKMELIPKEHDLQKIKLLRCQFDYYSLTDAAKARNILKSIEPHKKNMTEGDIASHLVCEFMFFVQCEEFETCEKVLEEMKKYRKYTLSENFNYNKKLLAHLTENAPIYLTGDDFKSIPVLYYQLKVIHAFEDLNDFDAHRYWNELATMYPEFYKKDFDFKGPKSLFSLCLDKHRKVVIQPMVPEIENADKLSKLDLLISIVNSITVPISKGLLYERIWDSSPESKEDLARLTKLISRARNEKGIEIKSRKGTYYVDQISNENKKTG